MDRERKAKANGFRYSLCNFENIVALAALRNVLYVAKGLSVKLQERDLGPETRSDSEILVVRNLKTI